MREAAERGVKNRRIGHFTQMYRCLTDPDYSVAFSHDSWRLTSGSNNDTMWLWDVETAAHQLTLVGQRGLIHAVAFKHDVRRLAFGSSDDTVRFWDAETGAHQSMLRM